MHADEYQDLASRPPAGASQLRFAPARPSRPRRMPPPPRDVKQQRLREEAEKEPAVQEALDLFDGRVVDVREAKSPGREDA